MINVNEKKSDKVKIKICGITRKEEAEYLNEFNIDYAGFVFYEKSKRNIRIDKASEIASLLNKDIKKVAVTVSPDTALAKSLAEAGFDILQVHKELPTAVLNDIKIPVWRALNIKDCAMINRRISEYETEYKELIDKIDGFLIDAPDYGSGRTFEWSNQDIIRPYGKKFILAGGLNKDNVARGISIFKPDCVDVSSSVEDDNGKSREKIRQFDSEVRWRAGNR